MALSVEQVRHIALLSRLALTPAEEDKYAAELSKIFGHVELLQELDVSAVPPTAHPLPMKNVFRDDVVLPGLPNAAALANAPEKEDGCFKVPQVI